MFSHVRQASECLSAALDCLEAVSTGELRRVLSESKCLRARAELLESRAAALVARRERHGDGGAGLLNQISGLTRSDAVRNVRTAVELEQLPAAQAGVAAGEISIANAARLVQAARSTSTQAVQDSAELVHLAKTPPADQFAQTTRRWTLRHQDGEELAARHRRNRRHRHVRVFEGDDGSVLLRGSFDVEMGARISRRLHREAELLRRDDRRRLRNQTAVGGIGDMDGAVRTRDQRMADALDRLLAVDTCLSADSATSSASRDCDSRLTVGQPVSDGVAASVADAGNEQRCGCRSRAAAQKSPAAANAGTSVAAAACRACADVVDQPVGVGRTRTDAQIVVRADLAALLGEAGGSVEIAGSGPLPAATLQRLACNNDLSLIIFGNDLTPLHETTPSRAPTTAQRRALIARDGACVGCAAPPEECEAHHIVPWTSGGKTKLDNLVLVCWSCHDRIHDHNWHITKRHDRYRLTIPDPKRPNPAPSRKPRHFTPPPAGP
ncbi:DUF222 domain-containing protein [Candidatus Poriferisodalis sp.]|uniref:HNH endonuclease signature motif containing protein n=1 Tax=Candidatus Poriferisodalis sp. TaxID=3101277 RepID=UPI003B012132